MARTIGRYEVLAEIGRGGFGHVYRCLDPNLGTPVAVKTLTADGDAGMLARFRNEAATSRRLRHPNIVTIYDFGEQDGLPFIVMELLEGQDLHHIIETRTPLSLLDKVSIMSQIGAGLAHAHRHGVIHRDVKPANVMLLQDRTVKVMDFGIAFITQSTHSRLTPRGAMVGTFRYMAPDQFRGGEPDNRTDIFAYGLIFYELLTGVHPFHGPDPAAQMYNILSVDPVPVGDLLPTCPVELRSVIARLLQKDRDLRYQTLDDVLFDIEPVLLRLRQTRSGELVNEAREARTSGELERAQELLREALGLTPTSEEGRELREQVQAEIRRKALRPRVDDLSKQARSALAEGNPAEAVQRAESAIRLDPGNTELRDLLEEARSAAEKLREAQQLLSNAENCISNGDPSGGMLFAQRALSLSPTLARAKEILQLSERAVAEEKRKTRFAHGCARIQRLIELRSWNEASNLLDELRKDFFDHPEIAALTEKLKAGQRKEQDERELAEGLATARAQFRNRELDAALVGLEALSSRFPGALEVGTMLNAVRLEIEADRRNRIIGGCLQEGRQLAARQEFEAAITVFDFGLSEYPEDVELQRERRLVVAARQEIARRSAIEKVIAEAEELRAQGRLAEAVQGLNNFLGSQGDDAVVIELRNAIMAEELAFRRAAELREFIRHANDLIAKGQLETVTVLLESCPAHVREDAQVADLFDAVDFQKRLQEEKQKELDALLQEVKAQCENCQFTEALRAVGAFEERHGHDSRSDEIRRRIQNEEQNLERNLNELCFQATKLLEADPAGATALLGGASAALRGRPEVRELLQAAERAAEEKRAREAANELIAHAKRLGNEHRFEEATAFLETALQAYPENGYLLAYRMEMAAALEKQKREAWLRERINHIRALIDSTRYEEAHRAVLDGLAYEPDDRELLRLREELESKRQRELEKQRAEEEIQETLAKVQELLLSNPGAAKLLIESLQRKYPERDDVQLAAREIREAVAAAQQRQVVVDIDRLCDQEEFDKAFVRLDAVQNLAEQVRLRDRISAAKEQSDQRRAHEAVHAASIVIDQDPQRALQILDLLPESIRQRPEVQDAAQRCRSGIEAVRRKAAVVEIESLVAKKKFSKAQRLHREAVARFGTDTTFAELLTRIEIASRIQGETRIPAISSRVIAGGAVLAFVIVVGIVMMRHRSTKPPISISVEIRTDPEGTLVEIGGRSCQTPNCVLNLPPGSYQVRAHRDGFEAMEQLFSVDAGKSPAILNLRLNPVAAPPPPPGSSVGTLLVHTNIPDARVYVDNAVMGRTDESGNAKFELEAIAHNVHVEKNGFDSTAERKVTIRDSRPVSVEFRLTEQPAILEVRGMPAGVEIRIDSGPPAASPTVGPFTLRTKGGTHIVRITRGLESREISMSFESGQSVIKDWNEIAPIPRPSGGDNNKGPSKVDLAEQERQLELQAWDQVRNSSDIKQLQGFIDRYGNGPHGMDARKRFDDLSWDAVKQNDLSSLRGYVGQFPTGNHLRDAQLRIAELTWNAVEKSDLKKVQAFIEQNPDSPFRKQAQDRLAELQNKILEDDRRKQADRQRKEQEIRKVFADLNAAFKNKKVDQIRGFWPTVPTNYLAELQDKLITFNVEFKSTEAIDIGDDRALMTSVKSVTSTRTNKREPPVDQPVRITLHYENNRWKIEDVK